MKRQPGGRSAIIALIAATVAFIPVKSLDCPTWDVWVADSESHQVAGITVRLTYRNYSAEGEAHEIDLMTDSRGHVVFAPQPVSASLGRSFCHALLCRGWGSRQLRPTCKCVCVRQWD